MFTRMKVLIFTVTTGEGHNRTADAVEAAFIDKKIECRKLDVYKYVNKFLGATVSRGYLLSIDSMSSSYSRIYKHLENRKASDNKATPSALFFGMVARQLLDYVRKYSPDVIVSTHIFAAIPVEIMKKKYGIRARTVGVITNFTIHPYWEDVKSIDHLVIPSERLGWQCEKKGIDEKKLLSFGIPLRMEFSLYTEKTEARKRLGLRTDLPVVLMMGGSMGYGSLCGDLERIDKVRKEFQIVVVCGSNKRVYKKISAGSFSHNVKVMGYTKEISLIMDASDCIVTKPGGITVSEALVKNLPLLLTNPIPGHEERNMNFLINTGAAIGVYEKCHVDELVWQFFNDEERRAGMSEAVKALRRPGSAERLADFLISEGD